MDASKLDWKKLHQFQEKSGWCGPAVLQMILSANELQKTQQEIATEVYLPWWGTTHDTIIAYLSKFFKEINFSSNSTLTDLKSALNKNIPVIVNWMDDLDKSEPEGGHYSLIVSFDTATKKFTLLDPSNARGGIWEMEESEFEKRWFDYLDVNNLLKVTGWMLWVEPSSKKV